MSNLQNSSTSGAVFFAVCRGKVSEGLDFADHAGRAVVITGMPFATKTDPKVRLKREYLDQQAQTQRELCKEKSGITNKHHEPVNQAVGRVIRHRYDYGAIIFCDERFAHPYRQSQISLWIQPHIKCYSKFGGVVFTLTRFFRDGGIHGPTKLTLIQAGNGGSSGKLPTEQALDKLSLETYLSPLTTAVRQNYDSKASSSFFGARKGGISSQLGEILPANLSSLTSYRNQILTAKNLINCTSNEVKHGRKSMLSQDREVIELDDNGVELISPCSAKKRRFISRDYDLMQHTENSYRHSSGGAALFHKDDRTAQNNNADLLGQTNNDLPAYSMPSIDEETSGSSFLVQVREKLCTAEYKEFVGLMKALKSKAMRITEVLQSIARIFAGPERLPLLRRFKDYIPAKYHSLYEQHVEKNNETLEP
ncbi:regulator of telomere elongation helicase 1 [Quillaja saponaria]|uniref:Regulator of telomere elongation helicase 1 n=1 Tax=Quillaja saponaria TaxID=32244 RepID=A0AAD7LRG6_QUISA|nr:regulator of telomere elongation helicase 1 [Quillaja saponaria]